jgi:hypothetical protein
MSRAFLLLSAFVATLRSSLCSLLNNSVAPDSYRDYPERSEGSHSSRLSSLFSISNKLILLCMFFLLINSDLFSQTKQTESIQQTWFGYFNQARSSNRWGTWTDIHLRTKEDLVADISQSILRFGLTYYLNDDTKLTAGYAYVSHYPADNHKNVTMPEHRPWQQLQWHTRSPNLRLMQWIRVEERLRRKILNDDELAEGYNFNFRARYNILAQFPLNKRRFQPKTLSFVVNDEVHVNFGKQVVYNYFDQNRFFLGFAFHVNKHDNLQVGYMNVFQQLASGNKYRSNHVARVFYFHNLDLRKK